MSRRTRVALWFSCTTMLGAGCDLQTKSWAVDALQGLPGRTMTLIEPYVSLSLAFNRGTAFSLVTELGAARAIFGVVALITVVVLAVMAVRSAGSGWRAIPMGLIAGGAIGNGWDRMLREGVVDFIKVSVPSLGTWPTFNIADALIAVGVALWAVQSLSARRKPPDPAPIAA